MRAERRLSTPCPDRDVGKRSENADPALASIVESATAPLHGLSRPVKRVDPIRGS